MAVIPAEIQNRHLADTTQHYCLCPPAHKSLDEEVVLVMTTCVLKLKRVRFTQTLMLI